MTLEASLSKNLSSKGKLNHIAKQTTAQTVLVLFPLTVKMSFQEKRPLRLFHHSVSILTSLVT